MKNLTLWIFRVVLVLGLSLNAFGAEVKVIDANWVINQNGSNIYTAGDTVTLSAKLIGAENYANVTFKIYENDAFIDDYIDSVKGSVKLKSDGYYYVTANWPAKWVNDGVGNPEYIFKVSFGQSNTKTSSNQIIVLRKPEIIVQYHQDTHRLNIVLYDKFYKSLLTDRNVQVKVNSQTYNLKTESKFSGGNPGIAMIENINLNLPAKVTVKITDDSLPNISKTFTIEKEKKLINDFTSLKLKFDSKKNSSYKHTFG